MFPRVHHEINILFDKKHDIFITKKEVLFQRNVKSLQANLIRRPTRGIIGTGLLGLKNVPGYSMSIIERGLSRWLECKQRRKLTSPNNSDFLVLQVHYQNCRVLYISHFFSRKKKGEKNNTTERARRKGHTHKEATDVVLV